MKMWAEACKVCKTHRDRPCGLCKNITICRTRKTDYCFDCADAEFCQAKEADGWHYLDGRWQQCQSRQFYKTIIAEGRGEIEERL